MSVVAYTRFKFLWGAVDAASGDHNPYTGAQVARLSADATAAGVAGRRVQLVFSRTPPSTFSEDVAVMHFDFLRAPGGTATDTWAAGDFAAIETALNTFWTAINGRINNHVKLTQYRWYRIGPGIAPPNPPVRVTTGPNTAGSGSVEMPPQCACSIALHTGIRRSWGRTYIPGIGSLQLNANGGTLTPGSVDVFANAAHALLTSSAASDAYMVVYSSRRAALLNVEAIACDDIVDIIRRRRWEHPTYRKQLP